MKITTRISVILILLLALTGSIVFSLIGMDVSEKNTTELKSVVTEITKSEMESIIAYEIRVKDFDATLCIPKEIVESKGFNVVDSIKVGDTITYRMENMRLKSAKKGELISMASLSIKDEVLYSIDDYNVFNVHYLEKFQDSKNVMHIILAIALVYNVIVLSIQVRRNKKLCK